MNLLQSLLLVIGFSLISSAHADATILVRLQGSNTIGAKLAPNLAKAFLEQRGIVQVSIKPTAVENEFLVSGIDSRNRREVGIMVAAHGTATGFQAMAEGQADIAMASRPIKAEESLQLQKFGDLRALSAEHALALDGLAILINPQNPVSTLNREQVAGLFAGTIRNWKEIGGPDSPVVIYSRDDRSGTWETFKELVLGKNYQLDNSAQRFESSDKLSDAVAANPAAIGFSGLASIRKAKALAIADGSIAALLPTPATIATEDYVLTRRLFLYAPPSKGMGSTEAGSTGANIAEEFIGYCLSHPGQAIVANVGFVSQNIEIMPRQIPDTAPATYRDLASSARRLSVNFRFNDGSSQLDNKALRDIDRLTSFLKQPENSKRNVYLIGFSDTEKNPKRDHVISRFRALAVRAALMQKEVPVFGIDGLGAFMPVATSAEIAAAKNGRVEVWVGPET